MSLMAALLRGLAGLCLVLSALLWALRSWSGQSGLTAALATLAPWAVFGFIVAAVCALADLTLWVLARLRGRRPRRGAVRAGVACVAGAVGAVLVAVSLAPLYLGSTPAAADDDRRLRVLTLNLLGGAASTEQTMALLREERPDVVALQEITPTQLRELDAAGLDELVTHRVGRAGGSASGTVLLSRWPLREARRIPTALGSWSAELAVPGGGLRVAAVHPLPPTAGGWRGDLAAVAEAGEGVDVMAGDFNAGRDHAPFRAVLDAGLRDAAEQANAGWQPTWPASGRMNLWGVPVLAFAPIDHVLVRDPLVARTVERHEVEGTDHLGISAELTVRRDAT